MAHFSDDFQKHLKLQKLHIALKMLNYTDVLFHKLNTNINKLDEHIRMIPELSLISLSALLQDSKFIAC